MKTIQLLGGPLDGGEVVIADSCPLIRTATPLGLRSDPWLNGELVPTYHACFYKETVDPSVYEYAGE